MEGSGVGWKGGRAGRRMQVGPARDVAEVGEDGFGVAMGLRGGFGEPEGSVQITPWPGGVDQDPGRGPEGACRAGSAKMDCVAGELGWIEQGGFVDVGPQPGRLGEEEGVKIGSIPVGVGDGVRGTRGDEEFAGAIRGVGPAGSGRVVVEGETAFEPAANVRVGGLPAAPLGEGLEGRQMIALGQFLQDEVGDGRRGFADDEAGVALALDEENAKVELARDLREDRPGEPAANNGEVVGGGGGRFQIQAEGGGKVTSSSSGLKRKVVRRGISREDHSEEGGISREAAKARRRGWIPAEAQRRGGAEEWVQMGHPRHIPPRRRVAVGNVLVLAVAAATQRGKTNGGAATRRRGGEGWGG